MCLLSCHAYVMHKVLGSGFVFFATLAISFSVQPLLSAEANSYCRGLVSCTPQPSGQSIRSGCQDINSKLNQLRGEEAGIASKWPGLAQQNSQMNATASAQQGVPASDMADAMRGAYTQQAGEAQACSAKATQLQAQADSWKGQASGSVVPTFPGASQCKQAINDAGDKLKEEAKKVQEKCDQHKSDADQLKERVGRTDNTVDSVKQEDRPQPQEQSQEQSGQPQDQSGDQGGEQGGGDQGGGAPGGAPPPGGGGGEEQSPQPQPEERDEPRYVAPDDEEDDEEEEDEDRPDPIEGSSSPAQAVVPLNGDETISQRLERFGHDGANTSRIAAHSQRDPSTRRAASSQSNDRRLSADQRRDAARRVHAYDGGEDPSFYKQDTLLRQGDVALSPDFLNGDSTIRPFDVVEVTYQLQDGSEKIHRGRYIDIVDDGSRGRVRLFDPQNQYADLNYARIVSVKHSKSGPNKNHKDPSRRAAAVQAERTGMSFRDASWPEGFAGDNSRP